MGDDNLTDSQRRIVAAVRREMVQIADEIKAEIEKLRQEQRERHQQGEADAELKRIRQSVRRLAYSLLSIVGVDLDEIMTWSIRQRNKGR